MNIKKILFVFCICSITLPVFALDWQKLYMNAARTDPFDASEQVKRNPNSIEPMVLLGFVYLNNNELDKAVVIFNQVLAKLPDTYEARWGLAEIMTRTGKLEESAKELNIILKEHPEFTPAQVSMAYLKFNAKQYDEALKISESLLIRGQAAVGADVYLRAYLMWAAIHGMAIHEGGEKIRFVFAQVVLPGIVKARKFIPADAQSYFGLGMFFLTAPACAGGDLNKAEDYLLEASKLKPDWADCSARLAQVYKGKDNDKAFHKYLDIALKADPANKTALDMKGMVANFSYQVDK